MDWHMVRAASCLNDLVFAIHAIDVTLKMAISSMTGLAAYAARTQPSSRDFMDCTPQAGVYTLQGCLAWVQNLSDNSPQKRSRKSKEPPVCTVQPFPGLVHVLYGVRSLSVSSARQSGGRVGLLSFPLSRVRR